MGCVLGLLDISPPGEAELAARVGLARGRSLVASGAERCSGGARGVLRVRRHTRCVEEERDRVEECTLCIAGRGGVAWQAARLQILS